MDFLPDWDPEGIPFPSLNWFSQLIGCSCVGSWNRACRQSSLLAITHAHKDLWLWSSMGGTMCLCNPAFSRAFRLLFHVFLDTANRDTRSPIVVSGSLYTSAIREIGLKPPHLTKPKKPAIKGGRRIDQVARPYWMAPPLWQSEEL